MDKTTRQTTSVNNIELYNRWAKSYDTDGNILQAIDDHELPPLLALLFALLSPRSGLQITELGCGTGRNTSKLLQPPFISRLASVYALDLSPEMLQVAQRRCSAMLPLQPNIPGQAALPRLTFSVYDALSDDPIPEHACSADAILSTLVLEHLPLNVFFTTAVALLRPRGPDQTSRPGYLLLTNMHGDMGARSQAGFIDGTTGLKVQGQSFVYSIEEMLEEARHCGFELVDGEANGVRERAVGEDDLESGMVGERGRKWVGCKVWFGCVLRFMGGLGEGRERREGGKGMGEGCFAV